MSALEDLVARLQRDLHEPERQDLRRAEDEAATLYNRVAHELAEKIRGKVYEFLTPRYGFGGDPKSPWVQGQMDAADLIDPEVDDD